MPARLVCLLCMLVSTALFAAPPRALPEGQPSSDQRLGPLKTLNGYHPFRPVNSKQAWAKRAAELRRQVKLATGLWPQPTRTPLNAVVHGKVQRDDYTVEKVFFESYPGHFVTGSLYRPKPGTRDSVMQGGKRPAVLCPHGHWPNGRFHDHGASRVKHEIAIGAERFEVGGRHPLQARCVQLARMGCIVFHYDMVGYADSVQFTHRPGVRESMNTRKNWGFFSPQAELRLQNMMGLQTWNSVRALDFVSALPDVDAKRIAATGGSGGGTQSFMIGAVDDRPAALLPAVMVSTAMQGGCTCENAPLLRVGAGNIDLAALAAPRPLGLTTADDWTVELATKGEPDLKKLYAMLGIKNRLQVFHFTHYKHNYNGPSRTAMYGFMNRHLKLGMKEPILEREYQPMTRSELSVWKDQHPKPSGEQAGGAHERTLLRWMTEDAQKQLDALVPKNADGLAEYRRVVGGAFDGIVGRRYADAGGYEYDEPAEKHDRGDHLLMTGTIDHVGRGEQILLLFLHPKENWNGSVVVWLHGRGKAGLLDGDEKPAAAAKRLVSAGYSVVGVDLLGQGEHVQGKPFEKAPTLSMYGGKNPWHHYAGYTYGYNHALLAQRAHDALAVIRFAKTDRHGAKRVMLLATDGAGPVAAVALAQSDGELDRAAIDTAGFRFTDLNRVDDLNFLPGGAKYHDLPGLLALGAPTALWLGGEGDAVPKVTAAVYAAAGASKKLTLGKDLKAAIDWLTR